MPSTYGTLNDFGCDDPSRCSQSNDMEDCVGEDRVLVYPRRKMGEEKMGSERPPVVVTREYLEQNFHMPLTAVSKKLNLSATVLKQLCRRVGIPKWPYKRRKRNSTSTNKDEDHSEDEEDFKGEPLSLPGSTVTTPTRASAANSSFTFSNMPNSFFAQDQPDVNTWNSQQHGQSWHEEDSSSGAAAAGPSHPHTWNNQSTLPSHLSHSSHPAQSASNNCDSPLYSFPNTVPPSTSSPPQAVPSQEPQTQPQTQPVDQSSRDLSPFNLSPNLTFEQPLVGPPEPQSSSPNGGDFSADALRIAANKWATKRPASSDDAQ